MNLTEILKSLKLDDSTIESITNAMKENKVYTAGEENLDIRYGKLKNDHDSLTNQYAEAQKLIEEMKKGTKGQEELQNKITAYEGQIQNLQQQLKQTQIDAAIKVGLLSAGAVDVDYLTFKLHEKGDLDLDASGKIKGWDDKISALRTQIPSQFAGSGSNKIIENKLPDGSHNDGITKEMFQKMNYQERLKLYNENPESYAELTKGN